MRAPFSSGVNSLSILAPTLAAVLVVGGGLTGLGCNRDGRAEEDGEGSVTAVADEDSAAANDLGAADDADDADDDPPVPVETIRLERGPLEATIRSSAHIEAENQVGVFAEAARRVRRISVEEGDVVVKGQLLLQLQNSEQRARVDRAKTRFEQAKREHERQQRLFSESLTSEKAATDAEFDFERAKLERSDAERELGYTEVRAPIAGTITERHVRVGDQVQLSAHLFDIVDFGSLVTLIYVPERELKRLRVGQPARLRADALSDDVFSGHVLRISPIVDSRSGTVKVTVAIDGDTPLRPGVYTDVEIVTAVREDALRLPKRALVYDGDQLFAYRLVDGVARRELVEPGLADEEYVEPLARFDVGDEIIVAGQAGLKDGATVEVVNAVAADVPGAVEASEQ